MTARSSADYLLDIHEIQQLLARYSVAIDTRELSLFDGIFAPDAHIDIDGFGIFDRDGYRRLCQESLPAFDATQHHLSPAVIAVGDEGATATARCSFVAQHARNDLRPAALVTVGGTYDDELAKIGGHWLITTRVGTSAWLDGNPAVIGVGGLAGGLPWRPGRACPPWLVADQPS